MLSSRKVKLPTKYYSSVSGETKQYATAEEIDVLAHQLITQKKQSTSAVKDTSGKFVENYIYLYHLPGDNTSELG